MAKPVKAVKKVKKAKLEKKPKKSKIKKVKKPERNLAKIVYKSIAETLQANSDGEYDLPSILTRHLDKSHPKFNLGLHREYYIPGSVTPKFYPSDSEKAMTLYRNQASIILWAFSEGIPIRDKKFDLPLCKSCR